MLESVDSVASEQCVCVCVVEMCSLFNFKSILYHLTSKRKPPPTPVCLFLLLDSTFSFGLYVELGFSRAVGWTEGQMASI